MKHTDNIDPNEVQKFEQLAKRWWDKNSDLKTLHDINPLRLKFINDRATLTDKNVLDVGCGGGILSESMAKLGAKVTGIDMASSALAVAKIHQKVSDLDIDYQHIQAEALAETTPNHFDVVTCMELLEHVPEPSAIIQACATLVKPGGSVFFSTLNRNPKSYLQAILGAEYVLRLLPKGTHEYDKFIRPSELAKWSRQANLDLSEIKGMAYNPVTSHYRLTDNPSVNYLVFAQKLDQNDNN